MLSTFTNLVCLILPPPNFPVSVDVGGARFTTARSHLCRVEGSMLAAMFSGRHELHPQDDGSFFLDRDGTHFRHIVNYLRSGAVAVKLQTDVAAELSEEADFYGLEALALELRAYVMDISRYLGREINGMRATESKLRDTLGIVKGAGATGSDDASTDSEPNPHAGLVNVFEDDGVLARMNEYGSDPMKFDLFLDRFRTDADASLRAPAASIRTTVPDLAAWRFNFNKAHPNLLDRLQPILESEPVLIAGGSALRALTAGDGARRGKLVGAPGDVDIFVCTQSPEEASRIAKRISCAVCVEEREWVMVRGAGVINLEKTTIEDSSNVVGPLKQQEVQIVLRLYESPAEVLLGFDCDCCCLGYDGAGVWALPRAVRAIQYGTNILNPLHAWPSKASYEFRLIKYASRGYAIAVPGWQHVEVDWRKVHQIPLDKARGAARLLRLVAALEEGLRVTKTSPVTKSAYAWGTATASLGDANWLYQIMTPVLGNDQLEILKMGCNTYKEAYQQAAVDNDLEYISAARKTEMLAFNEHVSGNYIFPPGVTADELHGVCGYMNSDRLAEEFEANGIEDFDFVTNWAAIEHCTAEGLQIPALLSEAWDASKRSREYLNAGEDDLDARYFAHVVKEK